MRVEDQADWGLEGHGEELRFYPKCDGKPLEDSEKGSDVK